MKVLFAVSNDNTTKAVVSKYQETYKEIITSKNVYYFNAIIKELQKDKTYDAIVIGEDLEPISNNNYEQIDKFLTDKLDSISDEASKPTGEDIPIIFICSDRRNKSDQILRRFFSMSIYNAILGNDRSVSMVCALINKPRNKKEAKKYYQIADTEEAGYQTESNELVSEEQIQNILSYYKKIGLNEKKCVQAFDSISNQYDDTQLRIIVKFLPISVKAILETNSVKYQQLMTGGTVLSNGQYNKYAQNQKGPNQLDFLEKDLEKPKLTEPVVIPSTMNISNSQVIPNTPQSSIQQPANNHVQPMAQRPAQMPNSAPMAQNPVQMPVNTPVNQNPVQTPVSTPIQSPVQPVAQGVNKAPEQPAVQNPIQPMNENTAVPANQIPASNAVTSNPVVPSPTQVPVQPENQMPQENVETSQGAVDQSINADEELAEKRGRGRPRKYPVQEDTGIKRRRGRPRKVTPEDEVGNPIASLVTSQVAAPTPVPQEENKLPMENMNNNLAENTNEDKKEPQTPEEPKSQETAFDPFAELANLGADNLMGSNTESNKADPFANMQNPFGNTSTQDQFANTGATNTPDPFASVQSQGSAPDPFANVQNQFANTQPQSNMQSPFGSQETNLMQNQVQNPNNAYAGAVAKKGKVAAFVGTTKNGTSFIVNNLAELLSQNGIKTAVIDLSSNKNAYYMYTNNDAKLMKTASESLTNLQNGLIKGVEVSTTLSVYTSLPDDVGVVVDANTIIQNASSNYDVVLLDCDFVTGDEYFSLANEIYLVQSMDAFTIQPLTKFLSDLKMKNKLDETKLRVVINKNMKLKKLDYKMIIGGMSKYNEPSMTLQRDLFNPQTIKLVVIPFEEANYAKYIEAIAMCQLNLNGYSRALMQGLEDLKNIVYPLVAGNTRGQYGNATPNSPMYGNYQSQKPKRGLFGSRKAKNNMASSPMYPMPNQQMQQNQGQPYPQQQPYQGQQYPGQQNQVQQNQFSNNVNDTLNKMRNY